MNISFRVFIILSAYSENTLISVSAYTENTANLWLFAVQKIVSEYAERIYAYIEKTPRDTKVYNGPT